MQHLGLKARMAIVGSIIFAFYAVAAVIAMGVLNVGLPVVLGGSVILVGIQYKVGKWGALRSVGAEDMPEDRYAGIHERVETIADDMGIEKPRLMIAQMGVPNAFAVGRKASATVVVSEELIQTLDEDELAGVLAHELAHVRNRDVVMMVLGQGVASIVAIAAQFAVLFSGDSDFGDLILAMFVGQIVQALVMLFVFAISRYREYVADADAAEQVGGEPLARALEKIQRGNESTGGSGGASARGRGGRRGRGRGDESGVDAQVNALCIFGEEKGLARLFATHPPIEKRIERLRSR